MPTLKPNKFHSKCVCFGDRKTSEERKICLKIRLFGFPDVLVTRSATAAARKVVSSLILIGSFEFSVKLSLALRLVPVLLVGKRSSR